MSNTSIHKQILDKLKWLIIDNYEMTKFQETENNVNLKIEANIQYKFVANCKRY